MRNLYFFGRFPADNEVGGVTTFTYRFSKKFQDRNLSVVDFYPAENKVVPDGVHSRFITGSNWKRVSGFWQFCSNHEGVYFFNFSSLKSLVLLSFLPKSEMSKWFAIFHNGEQRGFYDNSNIFIRFLIRNGIKRLDALGALSNYQENFLSSIYDKKIFKVSPYIEEESGVKTKNKSDGKFSTILISGFPTKIYRLIETLEVFIDLQSKGFEYNVILCLYGFDNDGIRSKIITYANKIKKCTIYSHLNAEQFSQRLCSVDIYIRMNAVDSFGLVVAEAIESNVITIATDVCERHPGANLIGLDDFDSLYKELEYISLNNKLSGDLKVQNQDENSVGYHDVLDFLQGEGNG